MSAVESQHYHPDHPVEFEPWMNDPHVRGAILSLRFPSPPNQPRENSMLQVLEILLEALNRIERLEQLLGVQQVADLEAQS